MLNNKSKMVLLIVCISHFDMLWISRKLVKGDDINKKVYYEELDLKNVVNNFLNNFNFNIYLKLKFYVIYKYKIEDKKNEIYDLTINDIINNKKDIFKLIPEGKKENKILKNMIEINDNLNKGLNIIKDYFKYEDKFKNNYKFYTEILEKINLSKNQNNIYDVLLKINNYLNDLNKLNYNIDKYLEVIVDLYKVLLNNIESIFNIKIENISLFDKMKRK